MPLYPVDISPSSMWFYPFVCANRFCFIPLFIGIFLSFFFFFLLALKRLSSALNMPKVKKMLPFGPRSLYI